MVRVTRGVVPQAVAVWLGLASVIAALPTVSQTPPTFPAGVELVRIDVVVLDRDGQPVTNLAATDFEVVEGDRRHEIVSFEPIVVRSPSKPLTTEPSRPARVSESLAAVPEENRCFLIFFDDVHIQAKNAEPVRAQLVSFLERETREGDWVTIVSPLAGLRWTARTAFERSQLPTVVRGLKGQLVRPLTPGDPSDFQAMRTEEYESSGAAPAPLGRNATFTPSRTLLAAEVYAVAKRRVRQSLGGLSEGILSLSGFRGRKSVIFYSEGFMKSPSLLDYDRAIDLAQRAHVAVYYVDPRGLGDATGPGDLDRESGGTSYIATATGGRISASNDLTASFRDVAAESSAYYLLGFQAAPGQPGERKLKVRVLRKGLEVRAPDRYIVGDPTSGEKPVSAVIQAVGGVSDAPDIPLRVATLFSNATPKGEVTTTVVAELERSPAEAEERQFDLLVEARPLGAGEVVRDSAALTLPRGNKPAIATRELHLRPGIWQARVVVRDAQTDKLGSVLHTFEVPSDKGLRVSSPILTNELEPGQVPRLRLRLDRRYSIGAALYCQYRIFGAALDRVTGKPRVSASFAIVRASQVIQEGVASPIEPTRDGQLLRLLGLGLGGFTPGDYTLVLKVVDEVSGQSLELSEPFAIVTGSG